MISVKQTTKELIKKNNINDCTLFKNFKLIIDNIINCFLSFEIFWINIELFQLFLDQTQAFAYHQEQ